MAKNFSKLTRPAMRKLTADTTISEHGVTFKRECSGDGLFSVNVMVDGRRIHRVVGRESDGTTRTQVEDFIAKLRTDAKHDRLSLPKGRKVSLSFRDAVLAYLARLSVEGGKDMKMKASRLRLHLVPYFGAKPISQITGSDVDQYKQLRLQQTSLRGGDRVSTKARQNGAIARDNAGKCTPGTINRELAALSHLLNKAVEWGWIEKRGPRITRLPEGKGRLVYLTVEQVKRLIGCAKESDSRHLYPYIVVALDTSMRTMEILSIRKENINIAQRLIHIPNAKAGPRDQPITAYLANFLDMHMAATSPLQPWLFPSASSRSGHAVDIRTPFIKAVIAAELDPREVLRHTLRHTTISHLVQAGVDLSTIKRISGHKTMAMVERYVHLNDEHVNAAMDKLEKRLH
ncbi:site-specific integrase [Janthinobacterium sp. 78]|uniref:tyrosine-type recombinase/integrase n=1 Tax=Janthinobacterium sp. 78 TaxID=2135631 RepID=UPI000D5F1585|nr:site-specific integrase [Janthinobacterium sp. 78]PVX38207.1 site-specific recombinase XerD [Janthinobacterium sp. 78]